MSSGSGLYQIDKLDDDNYDCWKVQMQSILVHCELWSYVSGDSREPAVAVGAAEDEVFKWKLKDGKALATMLLSVKSSQVLQEGNFVSTSFK